MYKIGIVFSGALSKGAYQLGFVRALKEHINSHTINAVTGTSSGSTMAYALSTNKVDILEKLWDDADFSNGFILWKKVVFNRLIKKYLRILTNKEDKINIPLYISSLRILPWLKFRYVKYGGEFTRKWRKILEGSIGFPIITGMPVLYRAGLYVDAGIVDNIPVNPILNEDLDIIFVLHFDNEFHIDIDDNEDVIIINLVLSTRSEFRIENFNYSSKNISKMKEEGYKYSKSILSRLLHLKTLEEIRTEAKKIVSEEYLIRRSIRSLDTWPTRLNRLFSKRRNKKNNIIDINNF